jgi:hypothetical protein
VRTPQGTSDGFYKAGQILPENFLNAARAAGYDEMQVRVREQRNYDHSYYFVSEPSEFFTVIGWLIPPWVRSPLSRKTTYNVRRPLSLQLTDASAQLSPC